MAGLVKTEKKEYRCSCGKVFRHRMTLERHQHVNGCAPAGLEAEPEPGEAVAEPSPPPQDLPTEPVFLIPEFLEASPEPMELEPPEAPGGPSAIARVAEVAEEFLAWLSQQLREGLSCVHQAGLVMGEALWRAVQILVILGIGMLVAVSAAPARTPDAPERLAVSASGEGFPRRLQAAPADPRLRSSWAATPAFPRSVAWGPEHIVQEFYRSIDEHAFGRAYSHLTPAWQRELPYFHFESGYRGTERVQCEVLGTRPLEPGLTQVEFALSVSEGGQPRRYSGCHLVAATSEGWQLDGGWLKPLPEI